MKRSISADRAYRAGINIGAVMAGEDPAVARILVHKEARTRTPEAAPLHRELCKIAAAAFETAGEPMSAPAILFRNLAKVDRWEPAYCRFTDSVRRALAKQAGVLPLVSGAAALHDKVGGNALKTLTAGGALSGAALGSLAFILSRHARQASAENAELLEKIRTYKQLKHDIEEDMAVNGAMDGDEQEGARYDV